MSLEAAADGSSTARVEMRNTGDLLVKGKGIFEMGGGSGSIAPQAFAFGSILPDATARVPVQLPGLHLGAGSYTVRVRLVDDKGVPLADWSGSAPFAAQAALESTAAVPNAFLAPAQPAADAVQNAVPWLPVAALLAGVLVLLVLAVGAGIILGRRRRVD